MKLAHRFYAFCDPQPLGTTVRARVDTAFYRFFTAFRVLTALDRSRHHQKGVNVPSKTFLHPENTAF